MAYEHKDIEKKWRAEWKKRKTYRTENDTSKPKYYVLDMFPYPSGAGLHVGHPLGYIASDIVSRYKRSKGFNVLHPMGYDSFGLPAEQYAIQTGQHPAKTTEVNIARYREQLDNIAFSFDWDREVRTSDPNYYKWTQWIFLQLFESWYDHEQDKARPISDLIARFEQSGWSGEDGCAVTGNEEDEPLAAFSATKWKEFDEKRQRQILMRFRLAYLGEAWVNWCPALGTVLANDEVKDGVSERGGHPVERKRMPQWSMRITQYAQRLLEGLDMLDWSESIKEAQRNWIGRSEGAIIKFYLTPNPSPRERGTQGEDDRFRSTTDPGTWSKLIEHAKSMRHTATEAEDKLWQEIRGNASGGRIRRQHIIDNFIVDFVSLPKQLVIEVDGDIHDLQKEEDAARTARLLELGFEVIRFRNEEVIQNVVEVKRRIIAALTSRPDFAEDAPEDVHSPLSSGEGAGGEVIEVFTTRPDTIFGVSFVTLAPEHELIEKITPTDRMEAVMAYVTQAKNRSERERMTDVKKVSGVFTGAYVKHPFTHLDVPVWVGDYVLGGYGTGAVMAVPAGDQRDWNFATHFNIPFTPVTEGWDISKGADESKEATLANSTFLNGLKVADAIPRAIKELEAKGVGDRRINFRLRDAAFGRQRYWGEPIPIYYKDGIPYPLPESELPLVLPEVDKFLPTEDGEPPLARATNWNYTPPTSTDPSKREKSASTGEAQAPLSPGEGLGVRYALETTTMPGWAGSSWYFLRYMDPKNEGRFASPEAINYWQQVDLYVGGNEHATGHLIYFRFWTKFLKDRGWLPFDEPAKKLVNQGMIQGVSALTNAIGREHWVYEPGTKQHTKKGGIYLSSDIVPDYKKPGLNKAFVKLINELSPDFNFRGVHEAYVTDVVRRHFPIDLVKNHNELDIEGYKAWRTSWAGEHELHFVRNEAGKFLCDREPDKMSKSKFNVVSPTDRPHEVTGEVVPGIIETYGADTLRLYEMFLGPIEQSKPWDTNGIEGTSRFLKKFWNLFHATVASTHRVDPEAGDTFHVDDAEPTKAELKVLHATLKKVEEDIDKLSFNTSVSQFMIACNSLQELKCHKRAVLEPLTIALAPFAPHIAEELWEKLGHTESITTAVWPKWDEQYLMEDSFSYPISFNGKTRMVMDFPIALSKEEVEAQVLANPEVQQRLEGKSPKKVIVVPKRIVNIVV
jgi:leucyl-tRNA synthetase